MAALAGFPGLLTAAHCGELPGLLTAARCGGVPELLIAARCGVMIDFHDFLMEIMQVKLRSGLVICCD